MGPKSPLLVLLLLFSASLAEIPEPFPEDPDLYKRELFLTGGADFILPCMGLRYREDGKYEYALRLGWIPDIYAIDARINVYADNPHPERKGTWYYGPEFQYYDEDGKSGAFKLGYLNMAMGREKRITSRWRWNWEAGGGLMVFYSFRGAGPPILIPIDVVARAELLYQVL